MTKMPASEGKKCPISPSCHDKNASLRSSWSTTTSNQSVLETINQCQDETMDYVWNPREENVIGP